MCKENNENEDAREEKSQNPIFMETGSFFPIELESMLNTLPFDITFVDNNDTVLYYSGGKHRVFARTPSVIGRQVQQCHPHKSINLVTQILEDFKNNRRDLAEFWLNLNHRLIYIRYFPVKDAQGSYLGCLEVTQDITDIQKIEGEKRLL